MHSNAFAAVFIACMNHARLDLSSPWPRNCSIHPRQAVSTFGRTWLPKPGSVLQYSLCVCLRVCSRTLRIRLLGLVRNEERQQSRRIDRRAQPNRAERSRCGAGAKAGSSGWPSQSEVGRTANLLLAVLRCAQRE